MTKILIIRLSSLGDIIHTYPMIEDIKNNLVNVEIDWLVDEKFKNLLIFNKNINNVITIPLRKWKINKFNFIKNLKLWKNNLINIKYDYIIDSQGLLKSACLIKFFKGESYGFDFNSAREKLASLFYKNKINTPKYLLSTVKNRLLAQKIFKYNIEINNINFGMNNLNFDAKNKIYKTKYVIFFHATSKNSKKYPNKYWCEIALYFINEGFTVILPYGNISEKEESINIKNIINSNKVIVPNEVFTFEKLYYLIYFAEIIIGVDTGLVHLANALNKKTIAIFTDTDPHKTGIVESNIAKNIGNIRKVPLCINVINLSEQILKV